MNRLRTRQKCSSFEIRISQNSRVRNITRMKNCRSSNTLSEIAFNSPLGVLGNHHRNYLTPNEMDPLGLLRHTVIERSKITGEQKTITENQEELLLRENVSKAELRKELLRKKVRKFEILFRKLYMSIEEGKSNEISECLKMIQYENKGMEYLLTSRHLSVDRSEKLNKSQKENSSSCRGFKRSYKSSLWTLPITLKTSLKRGNYRIKSNKIQQKSDQGFYLKNQLDSVKNRLEHVIDKLLAKNEIWNK